MNEVAVADETDIVCSFIFKNEWAANNPHKICGKHSVIDQSKGNWKGKPGTKG